MQHGMLDIERKRERVSHTSAFAVLESRAMVSIRSESNREDARRRTEFTADCLCLFHPQVRGTASDDRIMDMMNRTRLMSIQ